MHSKTTRNASAALLLVLGGAVAAHAQDRPLGEPPQAPAAPDAPGVPAAAPLTTTVVADFRPRNESCDETIDQAFVAGADLNRAEAELRRLEGAAAGEPANARRIEALRDQLPALRREQARLERMADDCIESGEAVPRDRACATGAPLDPTAVAQCTRIGEGDEAACYTIVTDDEGLEKHLPWTDQTNWVLCSADVAAIRGSELGDWETVQVIN